jgi:hypothetical protein
MVLLFIQQQQPSLSVPSKLGLARDEKPKNRDKTRAKKKRENEG